MVGVSTFDLLITPYTVHVCLLQRVHHYLVKLMRSGSDQRNIFFATCGLPSYINRRFSSQRVTGIATISSETECYSINK